MIIRVLWIIIALIVALVLSYKLGLSKMWTLLFTMIVGSAISFLAICFPCDLSDYVTDVKTYQTKVESKYIVKRVDSPVMLAAHIQPIVVPAQSNRYQPECYVAVSNGDAENIVFSVSRADYGKYLKEDVVTVTYYYIGNAIYNITLDGYSCKNTLALRDANIFTQQRLLKEAL